MTNDDVYAGNVAAVDRWLSDHDAPDRIHVAFAAILARAQQPVPDDVAGLVKRARAACSPDDYGNDHKPLIKDLVNAIESLTPPVNGMLNAKDAEAGIMDRFRRGLITRLGVAHDLGRAGLKLSYAVEKANSLPEQSAPTLAPQDDAALREILAQELEKLPFAENWTSEIADLRNFGTDTRWAIPPDAALAAMRRLSIPTASSAGVKDTTNAEVECFILAIEEAGYRSGRGLTPDEIRAGLKAVRGLSNPRAKGEG